MGAHIPENRLYVRARYIIPSIQECLCFRHADHEQRAPGADAHFHGFMLPRSHGQPGDIIQDRVLDRDGPDFALQLLQFLPCENAAHLLHGIALPAVPEHLHLRFIVRISQGQPNQKPVHLGIGQELRSRRTHAVFRGNHQERRRQRISLPVHGHLAFFHRLQQSGLGFAGSSVDLIPQQQIYPDQSPGLVHKGPAFPVIHGKTHEIGRQDIRRKLHPAERKPDGPAQRHRQRGFADPGHIIQQNMPLRQQGCQDLFDHFPLAGNDLLHFRNHVFKLFTHE